MDLSDFGVVVDLRIDNKHKGEEAGMEDITAEDIYEDI